MKIVSDSKVVIVVAAWILGIVSACSNISNHKLRQRASLDAVIISSMDVAISRRSGANVRNFFQDPLSRMFFDTVRDGEFLNRLDAYLNRLPQKNVNEQYDELTPIVTGCILMRDNSTVDTLAFGRFRMYYAGFYYDIDSVIFEYYARALPSHHYESLRQGGYFNQKR